jgi:hypothetical protein
MPDAINDFHREELVLPEAVVGFGVPLLTTGGKTDVLEMRRGPCSHMGVGRSGVGRACSAATRPMTPSRFLCQCS